ncbi:MAG: 16S rRNA (cytidine(1402)-2'-O)-methyltransferase [Chloroflexi bacterium]|nr:16S rRNA (cytidine(1402)-2'-O)-methyltransferase [Chloroflexota bacterium]
MGTLYIVATPIGNLEDITVRALRVLRSVRVIAAEDTRHSLKLLNHYGISARLMSYHDHNKETMTGSLASVALREDVALITDAGTPCISDPGYEMVQAALDAGIAVEVIPGANAITTALSASGLPGERLRFVGFPPRKDSQLRAFFAALASARETLVLYESPNRLVKTLDMMQAVVGDRQAVVTIELTKMFEEFRRGTVGELHQFFQRNPIRGEVTILLSGVPS